MVGLFLVFKSISILFSIVAVLIYIPINSARGFPLLYTLSSIYCVYFFFFLMMAILTCEMIPHCSFDLPSPVKVKLLNHVRLFATLWTIACKTPPSIGFSRQEYWSGFPFPSPGDLPDPGIQLGSPALQTDSLPSGPPRNPRVDWCGRTNCKLESGL